MQPLSVSAPFWSGLFGTRAGSLPWSYLDDFLFAGPQGTGRCAKLVKAFREVTSQLGVPLAEEKTEGPAQCLTFLGIEIDTITATSRLPQDKLVALRDRIRACMARKKLLLRELQQLVGHLNFACRVVAPGRAFLRRLSGAMSGVQCPHHRIRVTVQMKKDLLVWLTFLESYNGVSLGREDLLLEAELQVHSDAAGSAGFGIYFRGHWCAQEWPNDWHAAGLTRDLTFLEFFPIVVSVYIWGSEMADKSVHFWCDNMAVVQVINSLSSKSGRVMNLVRAFTLKCLRLNLLFRARHVPGVANGVADALSRKQMERFRLLAPEADTLPVRLPHDLWRIGE